MKSDGRGELEQARTRYPGLGHLCRWHLPAETGSPPLNPRQAQPGEEAWSDTAWHEALAPILSLLSPPLLNPPTAPLSALLPTPAPPRDAFLAALAVSPATSSRHPRSPKTLHPSGDPHPPPGTPASVGASRGREHGVQRGALRAPMLRSQGYHVMLVGCYGNGGFSQKEKKKKRGRNSL